MKALINQLADCHRHGTRLRAADWVNAVTRPEAAYAVQEGVAERLGWPLERWKSGGASPAGPFSHSPVGPNTHGARLGVEVEVALRIARDVSATDALHPMPELVDAICPALELIASRWEEGLAAPELLRMADFQSNAGLCLGPWQALRDIDWATLPWRLSRSGEAELSGRGGHSLANPLAVLPAWLRHATRDGRTVRAGTVVTTGAWAGLHPLREGGTAHLTLEGLGDVAWP